MKAIHDPVGQLEHPPAPTPCPQHSTPKGDGFYSGQGRYRGCGFSPRWGCVQEATDQ